MKKRLRSFIAMLISAFVLTNTVLAFPVFADTVNTKDLNFIRGSMHYSGMSCDSIDVYFASNLEELLSGDNTVYNKDIAVTADILATDIYSDSSVTGASDSADVTSDTDIYYNYFGMDNAQVIDLSQNSYTEDPNDITRFVISNKKISENKEIIVVAVEGTNGTYAQWSSNYDTGADTSAYTGSHSEWIDHDNHKGFDVTYRRVLAAVNTYIENNVSENASKTILITGHSRGGSIANLLGKYFEESSEYKSFTYTFAAPAVTQKTDYSASTIFNIINEDDAIPYFPAASWGFHRYGTDVKNNLALMTTQWKNLTGIDYVACNGSDLEELEKNIVADRSDLYKFNEKAVSSKNYATVEEATTKVADNKKNLADLGFKDYQYTYKITEDTSASKPVVVNGYICPSFLMEVLAGLASVSSSDRMTYLSKVTSLMKYTSIYEYNNIAAFMVTKYLNNSITYAHCPYAYYIMATAGEAAGSEKLTGTVSVNGTAKAGCTLSAGYNDGNAGSYITYQWSRVDSEGTATEIAGATSREYQASYDDIGYKLRVTISGVGAYTGSLTGTSEEISFNGVRGDVNFNGKINITDAQIAYDMANGMYTEKDNYQAMRYAADFNEDGTVDALDAKAIQYYVHNGTDIPA